MIFLLCIVFNKMEANRRIVFGTVFKIVQFKPYPNSISMLTANPTAQNNLKLWKDSNEDQESDPGNMRHVEEYIDNHTPSRHDYLGYFNKTVKNQFIKSVKPNEFECTFDKGLCRGWRIEPKGFKKDPRIGYYSDPTTHWLNHWTQSVGSVDSVQ